MTLLSIVKDVCATVGVLVPSSVFTNITANRTAQEMLATANEMAQRIAYDTRDWTRLKTTVTYSGDAVATAFNLPANYKRMMLTSNVWRSTSQLAPMRFIPDIDVWLNRRSRDYYDSYGEWTMYGGQIHIAPVMAVGTSIYFVYLDKNCIDLTSGGTGDRFIQDSDRFLLDERLLKLGMIWKWKAEKGSPYNEDLGTYEDALGYISGHDSPAPIIVGRHTMSMAAQTAYPFPTPTEPVSPL